MTDYEVGNHVTFAGGQGQITNIEDRPNGSHLHHVYTTDGQLRKQGNDPEKSRQIADDLGQDIFPSGNAWESLKTSARNRRTWILVFLYTVSFGGGFTSLSAWFPTYWEQFHELSLATAGLLAGVFIAYGSLIRVPAGSISDRFGGEIVAIVSFAIMALGSVIMTFATGFWPAIAGMMVLGTGMGIANAAVFEPVRRRGVNTSTIISP
jgi:NNP family nitrate/nitrite transporter-like MFS transporter